MLDLCEVKQSFITSDIFDSILNALPQGIVVLNDKGYIQYTNKAFESIFESFNTSSNIQWRHFILNAVEEKQACNDRIVLKNNKYITLDTMAISSEENTALKQQIIFIEDITQQYKEKVQQTRNTRMKELGAMSAMLAHQLRTPLSTAMIYTNQIADLELSKSKIHEKSKKINTQLHYMNRQISDLLFFVKGDLQLEDSIEIENLINDVLKTLSHKLSRYKVTVHIEKRLEKKPMICHKDSMIGALSNLIQNAIESENKSQVIRIKVYKKSGFYFFSILDEGHLSQKRIDELNSHLEQTSTKKNGNGFGLQFAKIIAYRHFGEIYFCKTSLGTEVVLKIKDQQHA